MAFYNKVVLIGNLTRDCEMKFLPSGTPIANFGLAINRKWRDKSGQSKDETCFVDIAAFGKQAETINQYVRKGDPLMVEGRLKLDQWQAQDGQKRSKLSVVVENFQFMKSADRQPGQNELPLADDGSEAF